MCTPPTKQSALAPAPGRASGLAALATAWLTPKTKQPVLLLATRSVSPSTSACRSASSLVSGRAGAAAFGAAAYFLCAAAFFLCAAAFLFCAAAPTAAAPFSTIFATHAAIAAALFAAAPSSITAAAAAGRSRGQKVGVGMLSVSDRKQDVRHIDPLWFVAAIGDP